MPGGYVCVSTLAQYLHGVALSGWYSSRCSNQTADGMRCR